MNDTTARAIRPIHPIRLYRFALSGHAHRVELMLSLLGLPAELVDVNLPAGEQKLAPFLARNPLGQVPVIEDDGFALADSNAILVYLALQYDAARRWLPQDTRAQADVQRWLGVAAGHLANGPAAMRASVVFKRPMPPLAAGITDTLFNALEAHLASRSWLVADHPTIADVALYTYTAHAPEGGVTLAAWPHIQAWLARIEALPGFVGMRKSPVPTAPPAQTPATTPAAAA